MDTSQQTKQTIPCNTAMDKSNAKVMDAAFSETSDRLVSSGELLNTRIQNLWQYSSFSSNRWGQLNASSSFKSTFQSKAHLWNDPANTADRTGLPSNTPLPSMNRAIPSATIFRAKGSVSTSSASWSNCWSMPVPGCWERDRAWVSGSGREAASSVRRSIIQCTLSSRLSGESRLKLAYCRQTVMFVHYS